ncbi:hypothetical protein [Nocardia asiatica]
MSAPEMVTLCGSMRFFPLILDVAAELTAAGVIVLSPFKTVAPEDQASELKQRLDALHLWKIRLADRVVIVTDETGYMGESTQREKAYAEQVGKPVEVVKRGAVNG